MKNGRRKILRFDGSDVVAVDEKTSYTGKKRDSGKNIIRGLSIVSELGFIISIPIVGGMAAGIWLDKKFASYPKLTLSFLFLGVIIAFTNLFILLKNIAGKK